MNLVLQHKNRQNNKETKAYNNVAKNVITFNIKFKISIKLN